MTGPSYEQAEIALRLLENVFLVALAWFALDLIRFVWELLVWRRER